MHLYCTVLEKLDWIRYQTMVMIWNVWQHVLFTKGRKLDNDTIIFWVCVEMSTLLFSIFIFVRVSSITNVGWNLCDYNRICEKIDIKYRQKKPTRKWEPGKSKKKQEINEVNFLSWFYCIKVNVLMTFSRQKLVVKLMEQRKNDDKTKSGVKGLKPMLDVF